MDLVQVIESVLVVLGDCERGCCPRDGTTAVPNTAQSNRRVLCDNWTQCDCGDGNRLCTDIDHEKIQGDLQRERLQWDRITQLQGQLNDSIVDIDESVRYLGIRESQLPGGSSRDVCCPRCNSARS